MGNRFAKILFGLTTVIGLVACVDDSYDLSKDIDKTVQLGTEGLELKLGSTERVQLSDLLDIDKEEMVEETQDGLFYLVEDGHTYFYFNVFGIDARINIAKLTPDFEIFNYDSINKATGCPNLPIHFKKGEIFNPRRIITAKHNINLDQNDIPKEVVSVKRIIPTEKSSKFTIRIQMLKNENSQQDFLLNDIKNLQIFLPPFIKSSAAPNNVLTIPDIVNINASEVELGTFPLEYFETEGELGLPVIEENGNRYIHMQDESHFTGNFTLKANSDFDMKSGDYTNVKLFIIPGGEQYFDKIKVNIHEVTGVFDPIINPTINPINISKDLPKFLDDEKVVLDVSNPTIKFNINMKEIPTTINFTSDLISQKGGMQTNTVRLPGNGVSVVDRNVENVLYFYQGEVPFDPHGQVAGSKLYQVNNLSSLIKKIPDEILVDLSQGHIRLKQDELQTIELKKIYQTTADYTIYIPFAFNKGLNIVYKDSTNQFNKDLKDYEAKGAEVSATIISTIPLALNVHIIPTDINGNEISTIKVKDVKIPAAKANGEELVQDIVIDVALENPADMKRVDKMHFHINADAENAEGQLNSKQYLEIRDMRIKLKGAVIADLN